MFRTWYSSCAVLWAVACGCFTSAVDAGQAYRSDHRQQQLERDSRSLVSDEVRYNSGPYEPDQYEPDQYDSERYDAWGRPVARPSQRPSVSQHSRYRDSNTRMRTVSPQGREVRERDLSPEVSERGEREGGGREGDVRDFGVQQRRVRTLIDDHEGISRSTRDREPVPDEMAKPARNEWRVAAPAPRANRPVIRSAPPEPMSPVTESDESEAELVADDGGPIAELLLHYAVNSEGELGAIYHDLFRQLRPNIQLQICCSNEASVEAFAERWGAAASAQGRQVHVVNVNRPITVWARDRRICRQLPDGRAARCFVPTAHFTYDPEKQNDLVLSSLLFPTGLVPAVALSSFHLEGGNVVSNRRHVFVGANAFEDNSHRFPSEQAMFAELTKMFGRTTVAIQGTEGQVPWIHTDMYLTPVDTRTILVASPAAGCRLLEGQDTIVVPYRDRQAQVGFDLLDHDSERQLRFDHAAQQLSDMGYQVIRMPSLINVQKDWMVTYNNVLMDYQDGQRVVYMPVYNIPELDAAATQVYRALGFDVRPIDVSAIFQLGGAIRCLANVTRRKPFEERLETTGIEAPGRLQVFSVDPNFNRIREPRPRFERRPLPPSLRERPQASIQRPADLAQ